MQYDKIADRELQELYTISTPGPQYNKRIDFPYDKNRVKLFVQACGIAYERDNFNLISDSEYDRLCRWLGDKTATAMNWREYPEEAKLLAERLVSAAKWRKQPVVCFNCWARSPESCVCKIKKIHLELDDYDKIRKITYEINDHPQ